jgi:predicted 3-demethylubiquinone-9 3-methyltransferase (glyoxalase superfamily)
MAAIQQKIVPHLWYDSEAEEAVKLYASLIPDSRVGETTRYGKAGFEIHGQPEGKVMTVAFDLAGQKFMGLNAGPIFKFNPSVSFLIGCETKDEVDSIWKRLAEGGKPLMELGEYPFSERYGWTEDRYGLSWQVMAIGSRKLTQKITPTLMFVGKQCGKAEEAIHFYASLFENSKVGNIDRYPPNAAPDREGTVIHASFTLAGQEFAAMDSALDHKFTFNEAISFMVYCDDQKEIDYFWKRLSAVPEAEACGWLKDRYGLSWQIVPTAMDEMLRTGDRDKIERVTEAFLKMKKFDLAELQRAYEG